MNHTEVIVLNKSANISEMSAIISAGEGGKTCCNNVEMGGSRREGFVREIEGG